MQKTDGKLVSVIIPALHRPDLTRQCLQSLTEQTIPAHSYETIVVENDAAPGMSIAGPFPSNTRVIELSQNFGTTGSLNYACKDSNSKYVLLLNNDVQLHPEFLAVLISTLEQNERCAFATGKMLNSRQKDRLDGAGDAVLACGASYRLGHNDIDCGQYEHARHVLAGCGAATLVRRSVFDEIAGLDDDFFAYLDDVDLSIRIHLYGYHGIYVPAAVGFHFGSATLGDALHPKIVEWVTRNQLFLLIKDYPASILIRLAPRIVLYQLLWLSFVVGRGHVVPYVKGLWRAIRLVPRMIRKRVRLMRQRRITAGQFLSVLMASEQQVYEWYKSQVAGERSRLLKIYFGVFRM
jgi:GT2 family glycosyltransferase